MALPLALAACGGDAAPRNDSATVAQQPVAVPVVVADTALAPRAAKAAPNDAAGTAATANPRIPASAAPTAAARRAMPNASHPAVVARRADSPAAVAAAEPNAPPIVTPVPVLVVPTPAVVAPPAAPAPPAVPFAIGEKLTYDVRFGPLKVGTATMTVAGIDTIRGRPAYHTVFRVKGGNLLYKVNDSYESWFDVASLASLRYIQNIDEGRYEKERHF
ncbi:MAG: DUF3108 domain-containing protein, partial [Candidatus Limnocylindrales bacterium]